jgi:sugar phosphate permease
MKTFLRTYWPHIFGTLVAAAVGAPAAVASYRHGMTVVARSGDVVMAPWLPATTDGLLLAALVALWARRMTGRQTGVGPWAAFGLGLVVTVATNLAAAQQTWEGWAVALWPPLCLAVVLELVAMVVVPDRGQTRPTGEQTAVDQPKLTDEQIVERILATGTTPSREVIRTEYSVGTGRADRIRTAVLTGHASTNGKVTES